MTCSFRTIEFRSTCWYSQNSPSATVKTGLSRISPSAYSPIRNVVACQLVRWRASRWTKPWSSISPVPACGLPHHRPERVHHDDAGAGRLDLLDDLLQDRVQVLLQHDLAEVDEPDGGVQLGRVEEGELLLVAQHLDGRLAQHGEVEGRPLRGGVGEHRSGGRASSCRTPGAPAMMLNEYSGRPPPRISSRPGTPVGSFRIVTRSSALMVVSPALRSVSSTGASGQASRTRRSVRGSPMNVTSSPSSWATTTAPASASGSRG